MKLSFSDVRNALPHRFPISLLDRVLEITPKNSLRAIKCVTANEPCFATLANGVPYEGCGYPQTLMIESFLQAAGIFLMHSLASAESAEDSVMLFGSLSDCVFHDSARPGDILEHHVRMGRMRSGSAILTGHSSVDGRVVVEFGLAVAAIRPKQLLS